MNNFDNINPNVFGVGSNFWDNGTVGNYWSNYTQKYPNVREVGSSGIGDIPYVIGTNNTPVSSASALGLAEILVMSHSPSPMPEPYSSAIDPLLLAALTIVAVALVLVAVAVLKRQKKQT